MLCMKCIGKHYNSATHQANNPFRDETDGIMDSCKYLLHKFARDILLNIITREDLNQYVEVSDKQVKKCTSCGKIFIEGGSKGHYKTCTGGREVPIVQVIGRFTKQGTPKRSSLFIENYSDITSIEQMMKNNLFCKDLMDELGRQLLTKQLYRQDTLEILPPPNCMEIGYIRDITDYIQNNYALIEEMMKNPTYTGYTSIQGERLELFWFYQCEAGKKLLWTAILEQFSEGRNLPSSMPSITHILKTYCDTQANQDTRLNMFLDSINNSSSDVKYVLRGGTYAMLIAMKPSTQQLLHIDSITPNFQFVLHCQDNSPQTLFSPIIFEDSITSIAEMKEKSSIFAGHEIDHELMHILESNGDVHQFMKDFGNLFSNKVTVQEKDKTCGCGTTISIPGSLIHAGPANDAPRAVIFFTYGFVKSEASTVQKKRRKKSDVYTSLQYAKTTQYNTVTLFLEIMILVWGQCNEMHKEYLLDRVEELIKVHNFDSNVHSPGNYSQILRGYLNSVCGSKGQKRNKMAARKKIIEESSIEN